MSPKKIFTTAILMILSLSAMAQRLGFNNKINQTLQYIDRFYVEDVNTDKIMDKGIESMLHELDPHSVYIPAKDVKKSTEALYGNFEGSGVAFQIMKDTINIVEVIKGGCAFLVVSLGVILETVYFAFSRFFNTSCTSFSS